LDGLAEELRRFSAELDPSRLTCEEAARLLKVAAGMERVVSGLTVRLSDRAAHSADWQRSGQRSPIHMLAQQTGITLGQAGQRLQAGRMLAEQPRLAEAVATGEVSVPQLAAIGEAVAVNPQATDRLLEVAQKQSLSELKEESRRLKAAGDRDAEARRLRIYAARSLRSWTDSEGVGNLKLAHTTEALAGVMAALAPIRDRLFTEARRAGRRERSDALDADALLAALGVSAPGARTADESDGAGTLRQAGGAVPGERSALPPPRGRSADGRCFRSPALAGWSAEGRRSRSATPDDAAGNGGGPAGQLTLLAEPSVGPVPAQADGGGNDGVPPDSDRLPLPRASRVLVRVDFDALLRGYPVDGEVCEIAGVGPVPVSAVRRMIASGNAILTALASHGQAVMGVANVRRRPNRAQQAVLAWAQPGCAVQGCGRKARLERDHRVPWADSKVTLVEHLDLLCQHHHRLKTYENWALASGSGKRAFVPPDDPRHPRFRTDDGRPPDAQPP
jgi:hypothetical protein